MTAPPGKDFDPNRLPAMDAGQARTAVNPVTGLKAPFLAVEMPVVVNTRSPSLNSLSKDFDYGFIKVD